MDGPYAVTSTLVVRPVTRRGSPWRARRRSFGRWWSAGRTCATPTAPDRRSQPEHHASTERLHSTLALRQNPCASDIGNCKGQKGTPTTFSFRNDGCPLFIFIPDGEDSFPISQPEGEAHAGTRMVKRCLGSRYERAELHMARCGRTLTCVGGRKSWTALSVR